MATLQAPLFSSAGESQGKFDLPEALFGASGSRRILHETIVALQANQRRGTSATKTRGLVSGGGHKPWKQKGTGNARSGSIRSPLWRKGGIIFGPSPRSYRIDLPAAKRLAALQAALAAKGQAEEVRVIENFSFKDAKTREASAVLKKVGIPSKILIVLEKKDPAIVRALRNVAGATITEGKDVNALQLLSAKQVLFTKAALESLSARFTQG